MLTKEIPDVDVSQKDCLKLMSLLSKNKNIKVNKYYNYEIGHCALDISSKKISENSKRIGLGEFESFMSISFDRKYQDVNSEVPFVVAISKKKKDDSISIPKSCYILQIHSHSGKPPVLHLHMECMKGYDLEQIAEFINEITRINEKNTDI